MNIYVVSSSLVGSGSNGEINDIVILENRIRYKVSMPNITNAIRRFIMNTDLRPKLI